MRTGRTILSIQKSYQACFAIGLQIGFQRPRGRRLKLSKSIASQIHSRYTICDQKSHIAAIFCLQEPGEHPYCGDGIHESSGLSYLPEEFYERRLSLPVDGINFYNFGWEDHQTTNFNIILKILKSLDFCLQGGAKVAVHCHAGRGRTALVICCYLVYTGMSSDDAIQLFKKKRYGSSLSQIKQKKTIKDFENCKSRITQILKR